MVVLAVNLFSLPLSSDKLFLMYFVLKSIVTLLPPVVSAKSPVICMSWLWLLLGLDVIAVAHYGGGCIYEPACFHNLIACHFISTDFNFKKGCKKKLEDADSHMNQLAFLNTYVTPKHSVKLFILPPCPPPSSCLRATDKRDQMRDEDD